jgi:hypothetical protein
LIPAWKERRNFSGKRRKQQRDKKEAILLKLSFDWVETTTAPVTLSCEDKRKNTKVR